MRHLDPDSLGIAALDEPLDRPSRAHLDACAACGEEVTALREVVVLARSGGHPARLEEPDPAVWDAIDLRQVPVVDVSDEPLDGDPTHSGVSVVRGTIDAGEV